MEIQMELILLALSGVFFTWGCVAVFRPHILQDGSAGGVLKVVTAAFFGGSALFAFLAAAA